MADALEHIEAAIAEAAKTRDWVKRGKSRQVRPAGDRDRLKAVAFAWLKTHRPRVVDIGVDVAAIDAAHQKVLDGTSKLAARSTYVAALRKAKEALVAARREVTAAPLASRESAVRGAFHGEPPPAFSSLTADTAMQAILDRRWDEVQRCISADANLAATVMMGGLLESLLLARINVASSQAFKAKSAPKDKAGKPLPLSAWKLVAMVEVAHDLGWITTPVRDVGNVLRDYRNYIHPHKEHADAVTITNDDARMFWEICKSINRQVLASIAPSP